MLQINWKVRLRQKHFLVGMFSAILIFAQTISELLGYPLSDALGDKVTNIFNAILGILTLMGVTIDPTTSGASDSDKALDYTEPK
jgi:phi LC3 family holin